MIKIGSCFTGIGAWEKGFEYLQIPYHLKFFCEIDKYPVKSYLAIFNEDESKNIGDITKVNAETLEDIDIFCYSPPCQAFSIAGKQLGFEDKRGILFFESLKIIQAKKPKICMMENVKGLTTKKFSAEFKEMLQALENEGYNNYWKVLNTKDYGLPQNRERVFVISIRKDIDNNKFEFPKPFDNGLRLKDILENEVDKKYYISQEKCNKLISQFKNGEISKINTNPSGKGMNGNVNTSNISPTITTNKGEGLKTTIPCITPDRIEKKQNGRRFKEDGEPMFTLTSQDRHGILQIGMLDIKGNEQVRRVYSDFGLSPALNTMQGGNRQPKIMVKEATKQGYAIAEIGDSINLEQPNSKTRRGRVGNQVAQTLTCSCNQATLQEDYRIRKLTPKECWRLQGFKDEDFEKASKVNSNSQLYKQAGNSISVNVVMEIYKELFKCEVIK